MHVTQSRCSDCVTQVGDLASADDAVASTAPVLDATFSTALEVFEEEAADSDPDFIEEAAEAIEHDDAPTDEPIHRRVRTNRMLTYYVCTLDGCGWSGSSRGRHTRCATAARPFGSRYLTDVWCVVPRSILLGVKSF